MKVPSHLRPWLVDSRSLTRRLRLACPQGFTLDVLDESWQRPLNEEARMLSLRTREYAFVRQVLLLCSGRPWVFARTIVPSRTLRGDGKIFANLGTRPLGAVLFSGRGSTRHHVSIAEVRCERPDLLGTPPNLVPRATAWSRCSVFLWDNKPLIVKEIFLSEFGQTTSSSERPS